MTRRSTISLLAALVAIAISLPAAAYVDTQGREWRQVVETTGLTWQQVAQVCPQDGITPCAGSVGGRDFSRWTWATQLQVIDLFNEFLFPNPALPNDGFLSIEHPSVGGLSYWFAAQSFPFAPTFSFTMQGAPYTSSTSITGLTATAAAPGSAIVAGVGFGNSPVSIDGGFGAGGTIATNALPSTPIGVWLWRPVGPDYSPPAVAADVSGTLGNAGWYVSDVTVGWTITDAESPITAQSGCDTVVLTSDTAGADFTCTATSEGGSSSASATVRRDATPPTVACGSNVFTLGQPLAQVTAQVDDAMSGPLVANVFAAASTATAGAFHASVTGIDRAGNRTTVACPYEVVTPRCQGLLPTLLGTGGNDTIEGTSGRDVIHALAGRDVVDGLEGDDVICGGDGDDELDGGEGDDDLNGGTGYDSIRGGGGRDNCVSGEARMSNCDTYEPYGGGSHCGFGAEIAIVLGALSGLRRRARTRGARGVRSGFTGEIGAGGASAGA